MNRAARCFLPFTATAMLMLAGVAHGRAAQPAPASKGWEESGEASWYGPRHAGRRTSTGEVFDPSQLTAAHATLPLGSRVRVTVQETGATVVVRINDRQPYSNSRVIDLSRGAASRIGLLSRGTGMVTLSYAGPQEAIEVAEAPDDAVALDAPDASNDAAPAGTSRRRHGAPRARHAGRTQASARPCCRPAPMVPVRRPAQRLAARKL